MRLIVVKHSGGSGKKYLISGILEKNLPWNFRFHLNKNANYNKWTSTGFFLIGKGVLKTELNNLANRLNNKIGNEQFFGVWCSDNRPLNLTVVKKSTGNL